MIRRIRIASNHSLVKTCRDGGYHVEYVRGFDGIEDKNTVVVEFPFSYPVGTVIVKDMTAIKQLEFIKKLQTDWSDNSVSCTVYYKKDELPEIKDFLAENWNKSFKTLSFLLHSEHGFQQAPYEEISEERYRELMKNTNIIDSIEEELSMDMSAECSTGVCPIR